MINPVPQGFVGSNPTSSIESSVQCPTTKILNEQKNHIKHDSGHEMRDLYHRHQRFNDNLNRINKELEEPDRSDVLKLVEYMQDNEKSILWINRCITALLTIRKQLGKPFREATKEDIKCFLKWMDDKQYKTSTNEKLRQVLRFFYKIAYGSTDDDKSYPDCVKWVSVKLGKEKTGIDTCMDMSEYLEEDEIPKLIECAPTFQKKVFLACLYESGARPEEFLRITNRDIRIDKNGVILMLRGKTGERRVRIITYSKLLQQWLDVHPLKNDNSFSLWVSDATNFKNQPLGIRGAEKIIENALPKTEITNKHARLYILRHSRATHLAKHFTEAQMCTYFGWVYGTKIVRKYIHLSGKDLDDKLLALNEGIENVKPESYQLKPMKCQRCSENIIPTSSFCAKCGLSVKIAEQYIDESNIERENKELKLQLRSVVDQVSLMKEQMSALMNFVNSMDQETKNQFAKQMVSKQLFK